jgi:alginate O-acetyltransferase complex protein AlgI
MTGPAGHLPERVHGVKTSAWRGPDVLFNSYSFLLVFLPLAIAIYAVADHFPRWRTWTLIGLSLVFYSYWDIRFLPLMVVSILANWWIAGLFAKSGRGALITLGIVANLAVLGFFKYWNFFAENFVALGLAAPRLELALPLGISFFTFHHVMYLVDLRSGRAPIYPLDRYALYICFFPQAIAGPLVRW